MVKRESIRATLDSKLKLHYQPAIEGRVLDIGLLGLACQLEVTPSQRPVEASFELGGQTVTTKLAPAWGHQLPDGGYRIGYEFVRLTPEHNRLISDYIGENWMRQSGGY